MPKKHRFAINHRFRARHLVLRTNPAATRTPPVVIIGLVHGHVDGFFQYSLHRPDIQLVGIAESDQQLAADYAKKYSLDPKLLFTSTDEMLERTHPQAALVYSNTRDHRQAVEICARHGVPVMMEKPLAVSVEDARAIATAAHQGHIQVLVNYETTWYSSNRAAYDLVHQNALGDVRKIVVHDGHNGPKEIGVGPEFLAWLTDPKLNGGGALFDFGCYGADLATWIMDGQRPLTVTAVTQHIKPEIYPNVDDEATVVLDLSQSAGDSAGIVELALRPQRYGSVRRVRLRHHGRTRCRPRPPPA